MRALDWRVGTFKQDEGIGVTRLGLIAPAGVPQEPADLARDTGRRGLIARALIGTQHHVIVFVRGLASADRTAQIGDALAQDELLGPLLVCRPQGGERLLVVADGV